LNSFSIIIVNWNGLDHLKKYLPSVVASNYEAFEVIIADNGSSDQSIEWVKQEFPEIKVIALDQNYFFAGGNNRASKIANHEWLVFLNNDVQVDPNWLDQMSNMIENTPNAGILQPKIKSLNQPSYFEYAGAAGGYLDRFGYPYCRGRIWDVVEKDTGQYNQPSTVDWASGAAMFIKKDLFEQLNGFDEDFEMHMEEIDLCWRARNVGIEVMYCPESVVYHLGGGSLSQGSFKKIWYNYRNNWYMLVKNVSNQQFISTLSMRFALDMVACLKAFITGQFHEAYAIIRAHLSFLAKIPKLLQKRTIEESTIKNKAGQRNPLRPPFLVWDFFILSKKTFGELFTNQ